jgi:GT2 family glycosyltransferase
MNPGESLQSSQASLQRHLLDFPADSAAWQNLAQLLATDEAGAPSAHREQHPPQATNSIAPSGLDLPVSRAPVAQVSKASQTPIKTAESAEALFRQAKTLADASDFTGCITLVEGAMANTRELAQDPMLSFIYAHALRNVIQVERALEVLLPFRSIATTPWIPFELGLIFKSLNRPTDAYLCLKEASELEPEFIWAAVEAATIVSHTNIPLGRLDRLTANRQAERDLVELTIERLFRFGNLLLVIGWSPIPGRSGNRMRLQDPLVPAKIASGGSCYFQRPDVNQAIGSEAHNLHGFTSLIDCSSLTRWSEVGELQFILESADGTPMLASINRIRLCDIAEEASLVNLLEGLLSSFRIAMDSGTPWHEGIHVFTTQTMQICSKLFSHYTNSAKSRSEVHWLNPKDSNTTAKLSFIFVQLGHFDIARPALAQICKLGIPMEVIVVNNSIQFFGETFHVLNRMAGIYRNIRFGVINNTENLGFSAACNIGASNATGEFLCFHNNDLFANASDDYLALLHRAIAQPGAIHSAYQYFTDGTLMQKGIAITRISSASSYEITLYNGYSIGRNQNPGDILACSGSLMLMSRDTFNQLNGFSEEFIYAHFEDVDLCMRASQQNIPLMIWEDITFFHAEGGGTVAPYHLGGTTGHVNRLLFSMRWQKVLQSMNTEVEYVL